jgi:choline dehydrogenase-like flavoprotein
MACVPTPMCCTFGFRFARIFLPPKSSMAASADASRPICIVGAGLTGSMIALMLAQRGYSVLVVEKRGDPRSEHAADGTVAKCVAPLQRDNVACSFFVFLRPTSHQSPVWSGVPRPPPPTSPGYPRSVAVDVHVDPCPMPCMCLRLFAPWGAVRRLWG